LKLCDFEKYELIEAKTAFCQISDPSVTEMAAALFTFSGPCTVISYRLYSTLDQRGAGSKLQVCVGGR